MNWIANRLVQYAMLASIALLLALNAYTFFGKLSAERGREAAVLELTQYKFEVAKATREAEERNRKLERKAQIDVERIANEAYSKQQTLARRADGANAVAASLRDEIARLNARPTPADAGAAACFSEARVARELLGACSEGYRDVAKAADELRDQVTGLQDYFDSVVQSYSGSQTTK